MPGIFINYRREDSGGYAQQIYRALRAHFGAKLVFMDIDTIRSGEDYRAIIRDAIAQSDVFLAVIGRSWLTVTDAQGNRRLQSPADLVRHEVSQALQAKILVIPVLVGHAQMPRSDSLPDDLKPLSARNAHDIPDKFFDQSVRQLIQTIRPHVRGKKEISRRTMLLGAGGSAAVLLTAGVIADMASHPSHSSDAPGPNKPAGPTADPAKNSEIQGLIEASRNQPPVVVRTPANVAALPAEVPGSRKIDRVNFSTLVSGPQREPKVVWVSKVSVGDAWKPICFAPDGTLFLYDDERRAVFAIKDGSEQWAWQAGGVKGITPGGQIVLESSDYAAFNSAFVLFNSRGEGGICHKPLKQPSDLIPYSSDSYGRAYGDCRGGSVTLSRSKTVVALDGNCSNWDIAHDDQGRLYSGTDRGTLYCFNADGKVLWTYKAEEAFNDPPIFSSGDAVIAVKNHLICIRDGAQRWSLPFESCTAHLADKSGTIFITHRLATKNGYIPTASVSAVSHDGKLLWTLPAPGNPTMIDPEGRLYLADERSSLLCLA